MQSRTAMARVASACLLLGLNQCAIYEPASPDGSAHDDEAALAPLAVSPSYTPNAGGGAALPSAGAGGSATLPPAENSSGTSSGGGRSVPFYPGTSSSGAGGGGGGELPGLGGQAGSLNAGGAESAPAASLLSQNQPVWADSEEVVASHYASLANDGDPSTRWAAADASPNHAWTVDLGAGYTLTQLHVLWELTASYHFVVEGSYDGKQWWVLLDRSKRNAPIADQTFPFAEGASARLVRVTVTGLAPGAWASFSELQVYGY